MNVSLRVAQLSLGLRNIDPIGHGQIQAQTPCPQIAMLDPYPGMPRGNVILRSIVDVEQVHFLGDAIAEAVTTPMRYECGTGA